jgi:hypothetical protein
MKLSKRIVSVIVVAGVLVSAGGIGLLIRQACLGHRPPADSAAADQEIRQQQLALSQQRPGERDTKETLADRMKRQELRAQELKKMASLTEEEKARFRDEIREQFSSRRAHAAEAEREKALRARMAAGTGPVAYPEPLPAGPVDANAAPKDAAGVTTEPNQAGQQ